jgi:hypothetical protein
VFTARYALSPYIKQIRFVFKGLMVECHRVRFFETELVGGMSDAVGLRSGRRLDAKFLMKEASLRELTVIRRCCCSSVTYNKEAAVVQADIRIGFTELLLL